MRIMTIVGARPQFIKAAAVSMAFGACKHVEEVLVHTGQHFDDNMSSVFFDELQIPPPRYNLGIGGGTHGAMTGRMLEALEGLMLAEKPDWVLVYGDTNSTLAGALAAVKLHVPVAHVEAGLRSFNRRMPEEINRVLTDHAASLLFTPTKTAVENLENEGIRGARVANVGDVMYDAAKLFGARAEHESRVLETNGLKRGGYVLVTVHRQENTDDVGRLRAILAGLESVANDWPIVMPLHPRTRKTADAAGIRIDDRIRIIPPVGYLDMAMLEMGAAVIATDSGGVQKEAYFYGVPCVTLRDETEWVELVDLGWNRISSPAHGGIDRHILDAIGSRGREGAPYGDGNAAQLICERLKMGVVECA